MRDEGISDQAMSNGMNFKTNRKFRRHYNRLFRKDPAGANVLLLLAELADEHGKVQFDTPDAAAEIARLMAVRFTDSRSYQLPLPGGPKK